jgi:hypothetical protein
LGLVERVYQRQAEMLDQVLHLAQSHPLVADMALVMLL